MKFKELAEIKKGIDLYIDLFGAVENGVKVLDSFHNFMQEKYTPQGLDLISGEEVVPQEVLEAFRPLYSMYKKALEKKLK